MPESAEPKKRCPFCAEEILVAAIKCRYCGEFLSAPVAQVAPPPIPESHRKPKVISASAIPPPVQPREPNDGCIKAFAISLMCFMVLLLVVGLMAAGSVGSRSDSESNVPFEYDHLEATHGKYPTCSAWDGSSYCVKKYIELTARDPESIQYQQWNSPIPVTFIGQDCWLVWVVFRAKNGFGAYNLESKYYYVKNDEVFFSKDK